ncbi:calcyphosin [Angomonas deanei]|nr:calcyphosin [Angomonas deanei]|eukprot:EPY36992.1 calcyphosin [Angomonas deanei]
MPPKSAAKAPIKDIVEKGIERLGKKQLWNVVRAVRSCPDTADDVREALRSLNIFISDDHYMAMVGDYGENNFNKDLFMKDFFNVFTPRRRHVVDLVLKKLDPDGTGVITYETLSREYDVLRHPDVVSHVRDTDDVEAEFFDSIMSGGEVGDSVLTAEEMMGYYIGISYTTPKDEDFELRCVRSFCLDRPRLDPNLELDQMKGSQKVSRQSRFLGRGEGTPTLYHEPNASYGKEATGRTVSDRSMGYLRNLRRMRRPGMPAVRLG